MIQPARVVPSNAPPLLDATDGGHASRVLQEHSGNRQLHDHSYINSAEQKYPTSLLTENTYAGYQAPPPPVYRQTPLRHHRHGFSYHRDHPEEQARREKQARFLYARFQTSDHYMKYRNRQHKDDKAGQDQKWPDRLELAFFRALVQWPPMGRRKLPHKDKQRGRNELIADYIEELTGELRSRKQVSSHIQVLKPFVEHDPHIMRWLSKDDLSGPPGRHYNGRAASLHDARRASHYSMHAPPQQVRPPVPTMTKCESYKLSQNKSSLEVFEPIDFQMFVQRKYGEDQVDRLHTYTSSIKHPLQPDLQLHECQSAEDREEHACRSLDIDFPLLAAMHKRRPLDCNVLVAQASLALAVDNFKDAAGNALPGVELGISFLCKSQHLPANAQVQCQTTFYKDGQLLRDQGSASPVTLTQSEDGRGVETQVKFGSTFWARTLAYLAGRLRSNTDPAKDPREEVIDYLQGVTACQEVGVLTDTGVERLLVIYWKFRLSSASQGRAYWMRILRPAGNTQYPADQLKTDRVDSVYEYGLNYTDAGPSHQLQPALQSPFEYDSTTGATLASSAWSTALDDATNTAPHSAIEFNGDNAFDFSGGNINISYDPALDFNNFDSSAFNFDAAAEFAADPALQDYSQPAQDYSQPPQTQEYSQPSQSQEYPQPQSQESGYSQPSQAEFSQPAHSQDFSHATDYSTQWVDNYSFEHQQTVTGASSYPVISTDSQTQTAFDMYNPHYDQQTYSVAPESQAYGGAGQDVAKEEEHDLGALADADYMPKVQDHVGQA